MTTFGERLAKLRESKNLSQAKLAKMAGVPQSTIAQIETGRNKSTKRIIELAEALDTTPNYLLFRESWLQRKGLNESSLKAMYVRGESMEPLLYDMDTVLLDINDIEIVDGSVYAIIFKNRLYIKELRNSEDGVDIISYHRDYETMHVTQETYDHFKVLGKMVWRGG